MASLVTRFISLHLFLWGHLKSNIYGTQPTSLEGLCQRIVDEFRRVTPQMLRNVREQFEQNLYYCVDDGCHKLQHLVNYEISKQLNIFNRFLFNF